MNQYFKPQRKDSAPVLWDLFYKDVHSLSKGWHVLCSLLKEKQQTKSTENLKLWFMTDAHNKYIS